ncbi:hypothetical protein CHLRE_01g055050v5 [Chlamydomonas reinhardtii]|uniref:Ubiquitin-like protease family profile domain-containing protein n=1 Tax=Chlamydomonas reinhardtii TaxID=3055 RepID=A8JCQ0_CHLRE|nr:uncharacterized protein CHLRE_01g055050v5 [Chlamydomonas reinhardtii]PNW89020.1 hypothetical protein CHLRE_01g055050v5 [Chlamydomonas reinhardtii]|eukprot:XP_001700226.1 predicted protein [Chlamydomonas reinhardtii]
MKKGERKVLDYGDVLLREADVELLEGPHWLNDQIVSFYFEYLEREALPATSAAAAISGVLLLPPATSFLLMHAGPDMAGDILGPLKPHSRGLVLLPVNDNPDVDRAAGGSHWSLLVFHRPSNTLRHYDSSGGSGNAAAAKRLAAAVGPALQPPGAGGGGSGSSGSGSSGTGSSGASGGGPRFVEVVDTPRQCNGYDCGVYVLAVARAACERWCLGPAVAEGAAEGAAGAAAEAGAAGRGEDGEAGGEGSWREWERGLRALITPAAVKALRREVREVIREKAGE